MGEVVQPVTLGKRRAEEDTDSGTRTAEETMAKKTKGKVRFVPLICKDCNSRSRSARLLSV